MKLINILGINISNLNKQKTINEIEKFLTNDGQHYIVTPNPEIILTATKKHDEELFYILNKADLAIADGIALKFAVWAMGKNLSRISGSDLLINILFLAQRKNKKVVIFNWKGGLSSTNDITDALRKKYPNLQFLVQGIERQGNYDFSKVNQFTPDIIFATLGAPWQEKFIYHNLKKMPSVKLAMAVGGSFDFLTGKIKRAPVWIKKIGLEWLWRLICQPWRYYRIYNAVIVFPYKFFLWRFVYPHFYRPNVACLLYKIEADTYKILITERLDETGHWQLPQGGTDGQNLMKAGQRELFEEIGTNKFKAVAVFSNLHQYEFGKKMSKFGVEAKKVWGYKGQKQNLFIAEFLGQDSDIKVNFWEHRAWKWAEAEKLVETVHPVRREATKKFLEKFRGIIMRKV
jgi:N-acetylglucosaminyldiphosphoundecaprenol N-acetyl-beta-D-mannosaminyltransferase